MSEHHRAEVPRGRVLEEFQARQSSLPVPPRASAPAFAAALAYAGNCMVMANIQKEATEQAAHRVSGTNKQVLRVRIDVTQDQSVIEALAEAERRFGKRRRRSRS